MFNKIKKKKKKFTKTDIAVEIWPVKIISKKKKKWVWKFWVGLYIHKNVFSRVWSSLYTSNDSDSVAFESAAFGEIKDHSLRMTPF